MKLIKKKTKLQLTKQNLKNFMLLWVTNFIANIKSWAKVEQTWKVLLKKVIPIKFLIEGHSINKGNLKKNFSEFFFLKHKLCFVSNLFITKNNFHLAKIFFEANETVP